MCFFLKSGEENLHLPLDDNKLAYQELHLLSVKASLLFSKALPVLLTLDCRLKSILEAFEPEQNIHYSYWIL